MKEYKVYFRKYIIDYTKKIDNDLKGNISKEDIEKHLIKIGEFQHERLIHLLVLILTLLCLIICAVSAICFYNIWCSIFTVSISCFAIPYVYYYFVLENCVQHMYIEYDEMLKKISKR